MTEPWISSSRISPRPPLALVTSVRPDDVCDTIPRTTPTRLSLNVIGRVLSRNRTSTVTFALDDGHARTTRAPFRFTGTELYLPAIPVLASLFDTNSNPYLECEVSEIEGLAHWRSVSARGLGALLLPTGGSVEREAWNSGIEQLRSVLPQLPTIEELRFTNLGVIRVREVMLAGAAIALDSPDVQQ